MAKTLNIVLCYGDRVVDSNGQADWTDAKFVQRSIVDVDDLLESKEPAKCFYKLIRKLKADAESSAK